ncbi:hypothetical protein LAG90_13420 [Marinilongibacter aquaticus]|uniref:XAC2610-related protein n=1 Tax=Marinilongibacter aquaticus TaxID=2975157 RepID=UPI0021BD6A16|nr:hypothetical protein [Marinilongibacter aquaticus]UBM57806.1 hypothetical protein LAG90_13420 [Marinilongibacter aquaticus]
MNRFKWCLLCHMLFGTSLLAQDFMINDFSSEVYAIITIDGEQNGKVFKNGVIRVLWKNNNQQILSVRSQAIIIDDQTKAVELSPSLSSIPINGQTNILFQDFNFDGQKDLAFQIDFSNKGPMYSVYLANGRGGYKFGQEISRVIQESRGKFELDPDFRRIRVAYSDGCCYRYFAEYSVYGDYLELEGEEIYEDDGPYRLFISRVREGREIMEVVEKTINVEDQRIENILSFTLKDKGKRVMLFGYNGKGLNYALIDERNNIEFSFPLDSKQVSHDFYLNNVGSAISFRNKDAQYEVYDRAPQHFGVRVKVGGKEYDMPGDISTKIGGLSLKTLRYENVYQKQ